MGNGMHKNNILQRVLISIQLSGRKVHVLVILSDQEMQSLRADRTFGCQKYKTKMENC